MTLWNRAKAGASKMSEYLDSFFKSLGGGTPTPTVQEKQIQVDPTVMDFLMERANKVTTPAKAMVGNMVDKTKDLYNDVDWSFIDKLEGSSLKGYVPKDKNGAIFGQSGVTIGNGFDLGQHSLNDLAGMGFDSSTIAKLAPYLGKKKQAAVEALRNAPLRLSQEELDVINPKVKDTALQRLITKYNAKAKVPFEKLSKAQKTVLASVAFQYGDLSKATPNFWKQVTNNQWEQAYNSLRNFGDKYGTRRNQEADYLANFTEDV